MKKVYFAGKLSLIALFGTLGSLSVVMFPFLIGSEDNATSTLGYSYLGLLFFSIAVVYFVTKKDFK